MFLFGALCFRLALMCLFGLGCLIVRVDLIVVVWHLQGCVLLLDFLWILTFMLLVSGVAIWLFS